MDINGAIAYIRSWRESQNLEALSSQDERDAADKLLFEKGYKLPEILPDAAGALKLNEGLYMQDEERKATISLLNNDEDESNKNQETSTALNPTAVSELPNLYPWEPEDDREFWCEKLQSFVRISGLNAGGTYLVIKSGEGNFRQWPVRGHELVLKDQAPKEVPKSDFLLINSASWGDIKNCLVNKFIPSYPWNKKEGRSPNQIREEMLSLAKTRKSGLASFIEDERKQGRFEDNQNFILRMNTVYESFPWGDFVQMLDFN